MLVTFKTCLYMHPETAHKGEGELCTLLFPQKLCLSHYTWLLKILINNEENEDMNNALI